MNDEEIIKSMECCTRVNKLGCVRCSFDTNEVGCSSVLMKAAYYLLERQKAEIVKLKQSQVIHIDISEQFRKECEYEIKKAKSEAIKEFAEELKKRADKINISYSGGYEHITRYKFSPRTIDNLVKEMTGED